MSENYTELSVYDNNGKLLPKESFLQSASEVYDQLSNEDFSSGSLFHEITAMGELPPDEYITRYNFIERNLYLNVEITPELATLFLTRIQYYNTEDYSNNIEPEYRRPICIWIDSPGGQMTAAFQIIDAMLNSKTPIITITTGEASSAAFLISIAGSQRLAFKNSSFLIHEGGCESSYLDAHKFKQFSDCYVKTLAQMKHYILERTNITEKLYEEHSKDDWYLDTDEAKDLGIIDNLCNNIENIPSYEEAENESSN